MAPVEFEKQAAHTEVIWSCAWTTVPDLAESQRIITGGADDKVKLWGPVKKNWELLREMTGHQLGVLAVAVSPDTGTFASCSRDSKVLIWRTRDGVLLRQMNTGHFDAWSLDYSADCQFIVCGGQVGGSVKLYDKNSGNLEHEITTPGTFVLSVKSSRDKKYIASGSSNGHISLSDVATCQVVHSLQGFGAPVRALAFSPDSQMLLATGDEGKISAFDVRQAALVDTMSGHTSVVSSIKYSSDGRMICSGSEDCSVRVWEAQSRQCLKTSEHHTLPVCDVSFNPNGSKLLSVSDDKSFKVCNISGTLRKVGGASTSKSK